MSAELNAGRIIRKDIIRTNRVDLKLFASKPTYVRINDMAQSHNFFKYIIWLLDIKEDGARYLTWI